MKIEYCAHSCFMITCGETKILFDPWLTDPTYDNTWFLWPLPVRTPEELNPDLILISHGHEDHLNAATLKRLNKKAQVFFPFQWRKGITSYMNKLGYDGVNEAINFKTYHMGQIEITYMSFSLESVIVLKYGDEVLVNINDALNSNHENAADFLLKEIKRKWPKITYLLSGWSGAGYFPNQIRYKGKNDEEVARLREQYFANNFCRFIKYLEPQFATPIAPGFVLLKKANQWINHIKFPRMALAEYYRTHYDASKTTTIFVLNPGDHIEKGKVTLVSQFHAIPEKEHYDGAYIHYKKEEETVNRISLLDQQDIETLLKMLRKWVNHNAQLYHTRVLEDAVFSVHLDDVEHFSFLNFRYIDGEFHIEQSDVALPDKKLQINTNGRKLKLNLSKEWGGDIITSGYSLVVDIYNELSLEKNLDIVCVRLITRYPIARQDLKKYPMRALRFYITSPKSTTLWLKQKIMLRPYVNKYPFNERDHWITYNKCDLCSVCKMPEINLAAY
jgi:hypothetical protein